MLNSLNDPSGRVRLAEREDEDELMELVRAMHPEAALRGADGKPIPLDEEMVRETLHRAIIPNRNSPDMPAWIGVIGEPGNMMGSVYLSLETTWYSRHVIMVERWCYVWPQFRRSDFATKLIEFAKSSADAVNIHPLIVGHISSGREEAKARFYRRHLGTPLGTYFAHNGNGAAMGAV